MLDWEELERQCLSCQKCGLAETRHHVVFGTGPRDAEVMCIGEGPGEHEDLQGLPFVGRGGQLLDEMLELIDLSRDKNVYIANMVKCRPPHNRDPLNTEQDACIGYLRNQVALIRPKIIICLGRISAIRLIKPDFKITKEHGQWFVRHAGAASLYTIVAVAAIVLLAAAMFWMKSHQGRLIVKEGIKRVLPSDAGYGLMFASCVVSLAAIAAAVVLGGAVSYYLLFAMVAWLFALLVYYTVKMM